jgi:inner membrane protein
LDPVTHMLTGACLSRAGLNRKTALATLTLALATESPDIDSITYFGGPVAGLQHHRGITHSFLGAPFVAAIVFAGVYGIYRLMEARRKAGGAGSADAQTTAVHSTFVEKQLPNWKLLYAYALLGTMVHLFQDFTNNYGLRPFAPFNPKWYSWDIVYIVDPIMLLAMTLALTLPGLMALVTEEIGSRKPQFRGRGAAICALVCVAVVIFVRDFEHRRAVNALSARTYQNQEPLRASAFPQMLNPLAWNGVVETSDFFHMVPVDLGSGEIDPLNLGIVRFKPEETPVTLAAKRSQLGRVYLDWAAYPLVAVDDLEGGRHKVEFEDLRFESVEGVAQHRRPALTGTVVLDPQLHVEEMYTGRLPKNAANP